MKKILLVEDDKKLATLVAEFLTNAGFEVKVEPRGDRAAYRILHETYFLVILDINLPYLDGLQICKLVRKDFAGLILMLTARAADEDQITGLEYGADDYVNKPIKPEVLLARIHALSRRATPAAAHSTDITIGQVHIDLKKREVTLAGNCVELKPKEYELLVLLASNAGTCLSRDNISYALRGMEYDGIDRSIDLRISYLRTKLGDNPDKPARIQTIRGKGYVLQPSAF